MSCKFGVGEYTTRCGTQAVVEFIMPEPCNKRLKLCGRVYTGGVGAYWTLCSWDEYGDTSAGANSTGPFNLLEPTTTVFLNAYEPCIGQVYNMHFSREEADHEAGIERIGVIRVELRGNEIISVSID